MEYGNNSIKFEGIQNLNLSETFDCGQCFRWRLENDRYVGVVYGEKLSARLEDDCLVLNFEKGCTLPEKWIEYFDLNLNYKKVLSEIAGIHPVISKAVENYKGIRILRQEPWEVLCSFIISQNNNIPRIKGIISRLCEYFGDDVGNEYSFPTAEKIASLDQDDLKPIRCGFRAEYILDAARRVASGEILFELLNDMSIDEARNVLMKIKGVGPKVAECALLYGFHRLDAFPMDVWMKKIMDKFFCNKSPDMFGNYAGIVQQYLYHYIRSNPNLLEE